jgi:hypothetical protein
MRSASNLVVARCSRNVFWRPSKSIALSLTAAE